MIHIEDVWQRLRAITVGGARRAAPIEALGISLKAVDNQLIVVARYGSQSAQATSPKRHAELAEIDSGRSWNDARRTGTFLFDAIFTGDILTLYRNAEDTGRCHIAFDIEDPALSALPWELLRDADREAFIVLEQRISLYRALGADAQSRKRANALRANLRVLIQSESLDEREAHFVEVLSNDRSVDVRVDDKLGAEQPPHVIQRRENEAAGADDSSGSPLLVVVGDAPPVIASLPSNDAFIWLPGALPDAVQSTFLATTYSELAKGKTIDEAVAAGRREIVERHGIVDLAWAKPRLFSRANPAPLVLPVLRPKVKTEVKEHTLGWFKETATGIVAALLFLVASLALLRFGLSSSGEFELDLLSPWELFSTFKGIVLALSTRDEQLLLAIAGISLLVTFAVLAGGHLLSKRKSEHLGHRILALGLSTRTVAFLAVATVAILGAYAYQQYLWRVVLPIRDEALGIAVTREVAAASIDSEIADSLFSQGLDQAIVVRELPVAFDAGNISTARTLGNRIGAKAVIVYRPEVHNGVTSYAADVIFADPTIGLEVGANQASASPEDPSTSQPQVQVREGVAIPALRSGTLPQLVNAAAGVIAYQEDRNRDAIELLRLALVGNQEASDTGIINFYLGNAYHLDGQEVLANDSLDAAIAYYQDLATKSALSPQDQLVLAKAYEVKGWVGRGLSNWDEAIASYKEADELHEPLVAAKDELRRPAEVHATFARIYTEMTDTYRFLGDTEQEAFWRERALEEIDALAQMRGLDSRIDIEEGVARFLIGDCTGSQDAFQRAIDVDPTSADPLHNAATVAFQQDDLATSITLIKQVITLRPDEIGSRSLLATLYFSEAIRPGTGFMETAYFDQAADLYNEILEIDPSNLDARQNLADIESFRATIEVNDIGALGFDDQAYQKSDFYWPSEPERRERALAHFSEEIDQRRLIALELTPGDPEAEIELIDAYWSRHNLLYSAELDVAILGVGSPDLTVGDQLLADAKVIREWTGRLLARGDEITRAQRLEAWSYHVRTLGNEWGWQGFFLNDAEATSRLETEYRQAMARALAEVQAAHPASPEEASPMQLLYLQASFVATALEQDAAAGSAYEAKAMETAQAFINDRTKGITHFTTICGEVREQTAGDELFVNEDYNAALNHYRAAIALNGESARAYTSLAATLFALGKTNQAIEYATTATLISPDLPGAWSDLGLYKLAAGDQDGSVAAYSEFMARLESQPLITQLEHLDLAASRLQAWAGESKQNRTTSKSISTIEAYAASIEPPSTAIYEYARVFERLGEVALFTGDAHLAERILRMGLEVDPHRPKALMLLTLAVIAQDKTATTEIEQTASEIAEINWANGFLVTTDDVRTECRQTLERFVERFPEQAQSVEELVDAIELAGQ